VKQLNRIAAALSIAALSLASKGAFAQDVLFAPQEDMAKLKMQLSGSVMGAAVKGAPYSGEEVNSSTQMLADGTRIHHENRTTVYRDSEGRVRRETPEQITIMDPVAGASYFLNPKTMTAQKAPVMMNYVVRHTGVEREGTAGTVVRTDSSFTMTTSKGGETSVVINGNPVDPKLMAEALDQAKQQREAVTLRLLGANADLEKTVVDKTTAERMAAEKGMMAFEAKSSARGKSEDLGKTTIEGVAANGTRTTSTIETGAIGNDRPIQIVTERWYSAELQTVLSTKTTDPRMGEISFQLTNVRRGDPGAYLFQLPAGYTVGERK
jgi:hypothetical protein